MPPVLKLPKIDNHRNVIIADDEDEVCERLRNFFLSEGFGVYICKTINDFMTMEHMDVCAIIMDMALDGGNGAHAIELVKQTPVGIKIPILICSDGPSTEEIIRGLNAGASDYIIKPYTTRELLQRVKALLRK